MDEWFKSRTPGKRVWVNNLTGVRIPDPSARMLEKHGLPGPFLSTLMVPQARCLQFAILRTAGWRSAQARAKRSWFPAMVARQERFPTMEGSQRTAGPTLSLVC